LSTHVGSQATKDETSMLDEAVLLAPEDAGSIK
jgi:hypothetical protein